MLVLGSPKGLLDSEMACVLLPPQGPRGGCGEGRGERWTPSCLAGFPVPQPRGPTSSASCMKP